MLTSTSPCRRGTWACRWCPASPYPGAPAALVLDDGRHISLGHRLVVGRGSGCDVVLDDSRVSRHHCAVEAGEAGHWLVDLDSNNGCWIDGARVRGRHLLRDGHRVRIGRTHVTYFAYLPEDAGLPSCPMPDDDDGDLTTLAALYDHLPNLPLPGDRCPLCGQRVAAAPDDGVAEPVERVASMTRLRALQRHLGRCPERPDIPLPAPPREPRRLALPVRDLEVEGLLPAPTQPEAVVRTEARDGAVVVGLLRADGEGAPAARLAGTAAAHLQHWLARHSPAAALHRLDRWLLDASHWAGGLAASLLVIRERDRSMRYFQAGGMPLVRLRRWSPTLRLVAPAGPSPGQSPGAAERFHGADLGWPTDETLLLLSPPVSRSHGQDRALRLLSIIASGRGILSLSQLIGALRRRGLAEDGSLIQLRLGPGHFRAHGSVPLTGGTLWPALGEL